MIASQVAVPSTPIEFVSRLTEHAVTPGTFDTAFSTRLLHAAQLMPVTVYCFMVSSYLLTVLIIYPHRVYVNPNFIYNL